MPKDGCFKVETNLDKRQKAYLAVEAKRDAIVKAVFAEYNVTLRSVRKTLPLGACDAQYQLEYGGSPFTIRDSGVIHWTQLSSDIRKQLNKGV